MRRAKTISQIAAVTARQGIVAWITIMLKSLVMADASEKFCRASTLMTRFRPSGSDIIYFV
ncbi:hypothetical protein DXU06_43420 [Bradyrhizobium elkanii]|jgi:hypothetical protein|nr:hypothetical protein XI02_10995 [Bradyrhizobium sp. CCBAU 21365]